MKKILLMFSVVLVICFVTTAFAGNPEKIDICHNGSIYVGETLEGAFYSEDDWVAASFVINISKKAEDKHVFNHGDITDFAVGEDVVTEVNLGEGGIIIDFSTQPSCEEISASTL